MTDFTINNRLFPLANQGVITLEGDASSSFLQGQISSDVRALGPDKIIQGAMCNLKGRVLALLDVIDWHGLKLVLPQNLLENTLTSLAKTAMLSRVRLSIANHLKVFGFHYTNPSDAIPCGFTFPMQKGELAHQDNACCYALSESLYILIVQASAVEQFQQSFINASLLGNESQWHELTLKNKMIQIYPETVGEFLPHRLDLHLSGYLSFDKGCYKGQEIVARTHYRAKLKHGLRLFTIHSSTPIKPGLKLINPDDKTESGEIIDCQMLSDHQWLIAVSILFDHPEEILINDLPVRLYPFS